MAASRASSLALVTHAMAGAKPRRCSSWMVIAGSSDLGGQGAEELVCAIANVLNKDKKKRVVLIIVFISHLSCTLLSLEIGAPQASSGYRHHNLRRFQQCFRG